MRPDPSSTSQPRSRTAGVLAGLTAGVLFAHGTLLHSAALSMAIPVGNPMWSDQPFTTRTITLAPELAPLPAREPPTRRRLADPPAPATTATVTPVHPRKTPVLAVSSIELAMESIAPAIPAESVSLQLAAATPIAAASDSNPAPASPAPPLAQSPTRFAIPEPVRLKYAIQSKVKGFPFNTSSELLWQQDGKSYEARLEIRLLMFSKVQTSKGELTPQGLAPTRFGDKIRSEVAAHFERNKGKVSFSANTPDVPLQSGAQDQLSVFLQMAALVAGDPNRFSLGTPVHFQAVGPRYSEDWTFVVGSPEVLELPGGKVKALRLTREATAEFDTRGDVWLAPEMGYLPVRIRLSQANGDFIDQQWAATEKP